MYYFSKIICVCVCVDIFGSESDVQEIRSDLKVILCDRNAFDCEYSNIQILLIFYHSIWIIR